ncbi:hypothetical protein VZT92_018037 [Zoarces viviparus]|uniref:Uncharacterized protein n=1 Tax=Zoarces viviparus TaxID=48416 RepID=A0AAW1EPK0_ZOAVI
MRQHSTLSPTPQQKHKPTVDVVSAAACEFFDGQMFSVRRRPTCETSRNRLDAAGPAEGGRAAKRTARPGGLREDLGCRRMDVD